MVLLSIEQTRMMTPAKGTLVPLRLVRVGEEPPSGSGAPSEGVSLGHFRCWR